MKMAHSDHRPLISAHRSQKYNNNKIEKVKLNHAPYVRNNILQVNHHFGYKHRKITEIYEGQVKEEKVHRVCRCELIPVRVAQISHHNDHIHNQKQEK